MNSLAKNNIRHPLIWVKPELDVTIKAIHSLLKTYTENFDDDSALKEINKNLHLLKGSLEILEFYGVSLLVESMQSAVKTIQFESTVKKEDVFESLLQATLSLEAYIDKLHKEQKDLPLSLLPVMNDIRASINEPLLSESALFLPNLSIVPKTPGDIPKDYDDTCLADSARSLRPYYQAALLTWYRDPTDQLSMQQMKLVARNLESSSLTPRNRQIWWIMGGLYEALLEQGLKPNISLKLLLAQADRVLKSLSQENNEHFEKSPPVDLLKNALYYISQSTSNGERIKTLKHVYNLNDVIPSDRDIATYRKDLKSPNSDALQAIAKELKKSLDQVKAIIDNFARNTPEETEKLIQTIIPLKHIADTMSLLSLGKEKQLLQSLINKITDIVAEPTPPGKEPMLEIASSMLHIESALKNIGSLRRKQNASQQNSQPIDDLISGDNMISMKKGKLPEAEYRLLVIKTAEEAQNNIVEVKNNVLAYLSSDEKQKGSIKHIPDLLSEIRGSMIILNNKYLPEILNALIEYVTEEFLTNKKPKTDEEYDAFAEALVSIEYYLEAIAEERNPSTPILDITCENLKKLGYSVDLPKQIDRLLPPLEAVVTHISVAPDRLKPNITAKSYAKSSQKLIENNIFTFSTDEPDPEVKEIFIEEAYDELSKMEKCIKSLKLNPADVDSLSLMRRIYHTLKGSGKIAGANDVSEVASIIDDYLARVLCNSVSIDQQGVTLLADAHQLLQQLVDSFQNKTPIKNQSQDFKDRISSLLTPKPVANTEHSAHEDHTEIEKTQASGLIKASQEIEKILNDDLNIIGQSIKHNENDFLQIESIERFIAERTHSNIIAPVSDELSHAISQLKISAEKTENREFIQTIELLSKYINNISKKQAPINQETLDILTEFCNTTKELLTELPAIENDEGKGASPEEQSVTAEDELTNSLLESEILETLSINQSDITPADEQESETETSAEINTKINTETNTETNTELTASNTIISGQSSQTDTTDNVNYLEHEDNIDLIDIFMEEALELIEKGNEIISDTNNVDETFLASFQRLLHTMKGSARMAGVTSVGNIAHMLESVFEAIITKKIQLPDNLISLTQETLDAINDMIEDIQAGADLRTHNELLLKLENAEKFDNARITKTESNQDEAVEDVIDEATNEATNESTEEVTIDEPQSEFEAKSPPVLTEELKQETKEELEALDLTKIPDSQEPAILSETVTTHENKTESDKLLETPETKKDLSAVKIKAAHPRTTVEPIRVDATTLDQLVDFATEESAISIRIGDHITASKSSLLELDKAISRTLMQMRDLQFESNITRSEQKNELADNLNLSSFSESQKVAQRLMESIGDIENLHSSLTKLTLETDNLIHQQKKVHNQLHESLLGARMVTFSIQTQRMQRILRQTCNELNKKAQLVLEGTDGSIDRSMLDTAMGPLEHIIRNAIAHGIESTSDRLKKDKPETGTVKVTFSKDKAEHLITISDDGLGLNLENIRKKALSKSLISDNKTYTDEEIGNLIFEPGFSTSEEVSQISGRGIGMDVVLNTIHELGGTVTVDSKENLGSTFTIRLPFTLSRNHTLIINAGNNTYALPSSCIEHTIPVSLNELKDLYESDSPTYTFDTTQYPLWYIDTLLNDTPTCLPTTSGRASIILVKFGQKRIALHVDSVAETRDTVLKPNSPQLSNVSGIAGATVMGDGKVVLIIDIPTLTKLAESSVGKERQIQLADEVNQNNKTIKTMVVDDSITVRKVTERFLGRNGITAILAKDGIEALELLETESPDVILLDIEMPNMDGLELAQEIKSSPRLKNIPIIMITSRTGKQHRHAASEIGVDIFLGKPYQESELLGYIQALTGKRINQ